MRTPFKIVFILILGVVLVTAVLVFAIFYYPDLFAPSELRNRTTRETPVSQDIDQKTTVPNPYDVFAKLSIGDKVGEFVVVSKGPREIVQFSGETTVHGNYFKELYQSGNPCFRVLESDAWKLPRLAGDSRTAWFCFSNADFAERELSTSDRTITIVIRNYLLDMREMETFDQAEFVRIVP
jgi:hypothetical protein